MTTSFGWRCRFPIIESDGLIVAVLLCDDGREHMGLLLHPSPDPARDPSRQKYRCGYCFGTPSSDVRFSRLITLGHDLYNLRLNGKKVTARWRDILITDSPPTFTKVVVRILSSLNHVTVAPALRFRIPHWLIGRLVLMGMDPVLPLVVATAPVIGRRVPLNMVAVFLDKNSSESVYFNLGICMRRPGRPSHWARATPKSHIQLDSAWEHDVEYEVHSCQEHHIEDWPGWTKDFGDAERCIRLSFSWCKLDPENYTLVVHIELEGRVYNAMKDRAKVVLPRARR